MSHKSLKQSKVLKLLHKKSGLSSEDFMKTLYPEPTEKELTYKRFHEVLAVLNRIEININKAEQILTK